MRKAFTLIELLVVIGIIAILMSLLLPGLALARRRARSVVGNANMRSLSQTMLMYTHDNKDAFLNPFQYGSGREEDGILDVTDVTTGPSSPIWNFDVPLAEEWTTEMFSYYWYSFLNLSDDLLTYREEQISPSDTHILSLENEFNKHDAINNSNDQLWPSSFLYSPTFWLSVDRYTIPGSRPINPLDVDGKTQFIASVSYPSAKVLLFERTDFGGKFRIRIDDQNNESIRQGISPAWNNIAANTAVVTADGSLTEVKMNDLYGRIDETNSDLMPSGLAGVSDGPPIKLSKDNMPNDTVGGDSRTDGVYPLFFWATQQGVNGRDLSR